ncbi:butyrate kinase [candidate division KSB1 bacterium]|nr:butyrate kinase [candidate division KSB1 bacterium]
MTKVENPLILVINPGSVSTKVAIFSGSEKIEQETIVHPQEELNAFHSLWNQFEYRIEAIEKFLTGVKSKKNFDAIVGRGGILKSLKRGTYVVSEDMINDARQGVRGAHVSNLGCALADRMAEKYNCEAYIVDPVSVDEFEPVARYSGHPAIQRRALSHSLNLRAAAFWAAKKLNINANENNFIVAHLGSGISIAPIRNGRVIDVNDASSAGPFSPERTGGLPLIPFIDMCFSGNHSKSQMIELVMSKGGLMAYLGTKDLEKVEQMIEQGDENALNVYLAMAYQIAKEIGAMATVVNGDVKAIVITGGLSNSNKLVTEITGRIMFIAPVFVFPGEMEMEAMAEGVLRIFRGEEDVKEY